MLAIVLATLGALARFSSNPIAYGISGFYVSFFRGTPLIVQMFLIYLALPQVGDNLVDRFPTFAGRVHERGVRPRRRAWPARSRSASTTART